MIMTNRVNRQTDRLMDHVTKPVTKGHFCCSLCCNTA